MKNVKTHHDLDVWKMSIDFAVTLYKVTETFPAYEKFGLVSQIRRAGVSISSNIAEGFSRDSGKELRHYISIALGSANEIEVQLYIALRLGFIKNEDREQELLLRIRKMLIALRKSIQV
jgi:four helix bundle protein